MILTNSEEDHFELVILVLDGLGELGITISSNKTSFCHIRIIYLWIPVDGISIEMDRDRLKCIHDIPAPKNKRGVLKLTIKLLFQIRAMIPRNNGTYH